MLHQKDASLLSCWNSAPPAYWGAYYESLEGQREFLEWLGQRETGQTEGMMLASDEDDTEILPVS